MLTALPRPMLTRRLDSAARVAARQDSFPPMPLLLHVLVMASSSLCCHVEPWIIVLHLTFCAPCTSQRAAPLVGTTARLRQAPRQASPVLPARSAVAASLTSLVTELRLLLSHTFRSLRLATRPPCRLLRVHVFTGLVRHIIRRCFLF